MKEVIFTTLTLKNFMSFGNVPFVFDFPKGINIITGFNYDKNDENGVGKSSIMEGFFWVLFGETMKQLTKERIVNDINLSDCVGILEFTVKTNGVETAYKIERGIKPSYCKIYRKKLGEAEFSDYQTNATIPAMNEQIRVIISATPAIFKNCITLSMNGAIPFLAQKKNERREFSEAIFRLEAIKIMDKLGKEKFNEVAHRQDSNTQAKDAVVGNNKKYETNSADFERNRTENIKRLSDRKDQYSKDIDRIKTSLVPFDEGELKTASEKLAASDSEIRKTQNESNQIQGRISSNTDSVKRLEKELAGYETQLASIRERYKSYVGVEFDQYKDLEMSERKTKLGGLSVLLKGNASAATTKAFLAEQQIAMLQKEIAAIRKFGAACPECKRPYAVDDIEKNKAQIAEKEAAIVVCQKEADDFRAEAEKIKKTYEKIDIFISGLDKSEIVADRKQMIATTKEILATDSAKVSELSDWFEKTAQPARTVLFDRVKELEAVRSSNNTIKASIANIEAFLKDVDSDIKNVETSVNAFDTLIAEGKNKLDEIEILITQTSELLKIFDVVKFITSDTGIKAFIVKKLLVVLNDRIRYYLGKFESNAQMTFDEFLNDTLQNEAGVEKSYDNFSDGEKKRIDLACLFSFLDIRRIQGDVRFNVVFYDELLDSAISKHGCDLIFDILKERTDTYGENAYIVTHRTEYKNIDLDEHLTGMMYLAKRDGFTTIEKD